MTTIIAKMAELIGKIVRSANLWRQEPTPEPTLRQKAPVYEQKAPVYEQKAPVYEKKAAVYEKKGGAF